MDKKRTLWGLADILVIMYALVPVLWIVSLSLKAPAFVKDGKFIPRSITLENYRSIFHQGMFTHALINSLGIGFLSTFCAIFIGIFASYVIARIKLRGKNLILSLIMLVQIFPQISLVTPIFNLERVTGLFDTWMGLIIPYTAFGLPLAVFTLSSFFQQIPEDMEKAAMIDGADYWSTIRKIILPLAVPGIITAAILVFISCWNDLLLAISLTATDAAQTAPVAIAGFTGSSEFEEPTGSIAAGAVTITIPIILFVIIFQRRIVSGLTSGAVKG